MELFFSILQSIYFAWGVAVVVFVLAVSIAKTSSDKHKVQINAIREEATAGIRQANENANELIRQARAKCDAEIQRERETTAEAIKNERVLAEKAIERERAMSAERIKLLQEQIEADKNRIMQKTEKEILADITISLGGFARRIERVESKLTPIEHEMALIVDKVDNIGVTVSDAQFHL